MVVSLLFVCCFYVDVVYVVNVVSLVGGVGGAYVVYVFSVDDVIVCVGVVVCVVYVDVVLIVHNVGLIYLFMLLDGLCLCVFCCLYSLLYCMDSIVSSVYMTLIYGKYCCGWVVVLIVCCLC